MVPVAFCICSAWLESVYADPLRVRVVGPEMPASVILVASPVALIVMGWVVWGDPFACIGAGLSTISETARISAARVNSRVGVVFIRFRP